MIFLSSDQTCSTNFPKRACWYDPVTGRWLSNDPIDVWGGLNQYVAFDNNSVNQADAFGTATDKIDGYVIRVNKTDVHDWPSQPHGHIQGTRLKVDNQGRIFDVVTKKQVCQLSKKGRARWQAFLGRLNVVLVVPGLMDDLDIYLRGLNNNRTYQQQLLDDLKKAGPYIDTWIGTFPNIFTCPSGADCS